MGEDCPSQGTSGTKALEDKGLRSVPGSTPNLLGVWGPAGGLGASWCPSWAARAQCIKLESFRWSWEPSCGGSGSHSQAPVALRRPTCGPVLLWPPLGGSLGLPERSVPEAALQEPTILAGNRHSPGFPPGRPPAPPCPASDLSLPSSCLAPSPLQPPPRDDSANLPSRWGVGWDKGEKNHNVRLQSPNRRAGPWQGDKGPRSPPSKPPWQINLLSGGGLLQVWGAEAWPRGSLAEWGALPGPRARHHAASGTQRKPPRPRVLLPSCLRPSQGQQKGKGRGFRGKFTGGYPLMPATPGAPRRRGLQAVWRKRRYLSSWGPERAWRSHDATDGP